MNCVGENLRSLGDKTIPRVLSVSWESAKVMGLIGGFMITFFLSTVLLAKDYDNIMNLSIAKNLNIVWGDSKTMIDFINQTNINFLDTPYYQV